MSGTWRPAAPGGALFIALRVSGAVLLAASGGIHLGLYLAAGYRAVPVIGWMFLLQAATSLAIAALWLLTGNRLAAAAGAGLALATLGGYLLSVWVGLFGFTEVRTSAGIAAGVIEVAAFAALAAGVLAAPVPRWAAFATGLAWRERLAGVDVGSAVVAAVSVLALALLTVATAQANGGPTGPPAVLKTAQVGGATVITNSSGFTLYWFAPDTPGTSKCTGVCASIWPPVKGPATAGQGVAGKLGTIIRPDGSAQATYNGHPLYSYVGDTGPRQAKGDGLNLNGGLWHEVKAAG